VLEGSRPDDDEEATAAAKAMEKDYAAAKPKRGD